MRQLFRSPAWLVHPKQIANARRRGNQQDDLRSVRRRAKTLHGLIAPGNISLFSTDGVERAEVRSAFLAIERDDRLPIRRPHRRKAATAARRAVVSADSATEVPIEIRS